MSLPLQGYYRAGKYMPVRVKTGGQTVTVRAHGAVPVRVAAENSGAGIVVPWLAVESVRDPRWSSGSGDHPLDLVLRPLGDDERLIAAAGADPDALKPLFGGYSLLRVQLDLTNPLPGPAVAWETLDGVVLDSAAAARMHEGQLRTLLEAGVAVAIRSEQRPAGPWPWRKDGAYWIVHVDLAGPAGAYVPEAYLPTQVWLRGWPIGVRREVLLAALVFSIALIGATLWRARWAMGLVVILSGAAVVGTLAWRAKQSVRLEAVGSVLVSEGPTVQRDDWTWRAVLGEGDDFLPFQEMTRPVFGYRRQVEDTRIALECGSDGWPLRFTYHLTPGWSLAFLKRTVATDQFKLSLRLPVTSPLRELVDSLYLTAGDEVLGQSGQVRDNAWDTIVIRRPAPDTAR